MEELKCPHCGSNKVEEEDWIDVEYISSTTISKIYCGGCTKCQALLKWKEVFIFKGYQNIKVYG